jgi:hypothetical protein
MIEPGVAPHRRFFIDNIQLDEIIPDVFLVPGRKGEKKND